MIKLNKPAILGGDPLIHSLPDWPYVNNLDKEFMMKVIESRNWGYQGPLEKQFTTKFANYLGAKHGLAIANGSVSLEVSLKACGITTGDEVIVPAATWIATASAVVAVGAIPIFVDIDPETLCLDVNAASEAITGRTKAIIPVHLYSRMVNMDELMKLAKKNNLFIIEDAAHSHGAIWNNQKAGTIGHLGSFSFQMKKLLTSGEGGFITTNDNNLADLCHAYMNCGRKRSNSVPNILGTNYRITEFQSAILLSQFNLFHEQTLQREKNANLLDQLLNEIEGITILRKMDQIKLHAYYRYVFQYDKNKFSGLSLEKFEKALITEGCNLRSLYTPVYRDELFPIKTNIIKNKDFLPETEKALQNTILLDHRMLLETELIYKIAESIKRIQIYAKDIVQV